MVTFVAACGPGQPEQLVPHPDGPTSDAPGRGDASGSGSDPGTGSGSDPLADYRSGTRIKMQVLTTPDGAKQFSGWFDTQRNEPCVFQTASDGVTRCLPPLIALVFDGADGSYVDAACSQPAEEFSAASLCSTVKYIFVFRSTGACPSVGPRVLPAMQLTARFVKSGTACTATPIPTGSIVYGVSGPEVPPSSFQSATLAVE